jgi:hypothetical protein
MEEERTTKESEQNRTNHKNVNEEEKENEQDKTAGKETMKIMDKKTRIVATGRRK